MGFSILWTRISVFWPRSPIGHLSTNENRVFWKSDDVGFFKSWITNMMSPDLEISLVSHFLSCREEPSSQVLFRVLSCRSTGPKERWILFSTKIHGRTFFDMQNSHVNAVSSARTLRVRSLLPGLTSSCLRGRATRVFIRDRTRRECECPREDETVGEEESRTRKRRARRGCRKRERVSETTAPNSPVRQLHIRGKKSQKSDFSEKLTFRCMSIWRTQTWLPFQQKPQGWGSCDSLLLPGSQKYLNLKFNKHVFESFFEAESSKLGFFV